MAAKEKESAAPKILSADDIKGVEDRATEVVEVPQWGGAVEIQALSAWDRSRYEAATLAIGADQDGNVSAKSNMEGANAFLVSMGMTRPRMSKEDLGKKGAAPVEMLAGRVMRLSGMDKESKEKARGN